MRVDWDIIQKLRNLAIIWLTTIALTDISYADMLGGLYTDAGERGKKIKFGDLINKSQSDENANVFNYKLSYAIPVINLFAQLFWKAVYKGDKEKVINALGNAGVLDDMSDAELCTFSSTSSPLSFIKIHVQKKCKGFDQYELTITGENPEDWVRFTVDTKEKRLCGFVATGAFASMEIEELFTQMIQYDCDDILYDRFVKPALTMALERFMNPDNQSTGEDLNDDSATSLLTIEQDIVQTHEDSPDAYEQDGLTAEKKSDEQQKMLVRRRKKH